MAVELIAGAALSALFQTLFQELSSILHHGSRSSINSELEKLKRKLPTVQVLLDDAERRSYTESNVNIWLDDLRELAYDMDDIVDEMNTRRLDLDLAARAQDQVRGFLCSCAPLDKAKSCAKNVKFNRALKSKINEVLERLDKSVNEANSLGLRKNSIGSSWEPNQTRLSPETSPSVDESEVYGRKEDKEKIIELLLAGDNQVKKNYSVISIVGMGGLGKTTLAKLVFQDERVKKEFNLRSWACVSDVFDVARVTKELIEYCNGDIRPNMTLATLQNRLEELVRDTRFLVVLDDIWTVEQWDDMKAPLHHCKEGSMILVTTRSHKVADAMNSMPTYDIEKLNDDHCWALFQDKALGGLDRDENLITLGLKIVQKCKGVPLAVKVLGAMLQGAGQERWEAVLGNELWRLENKNEDQIFLPLRLSYHYLPSPLKRCFEYFSLFPADYKFDKEKLVLMWIGEGFVEAKESRSLEDLGSQYFDELKQKCLIQKDNKIHDLVGNLACTLSEQFYCRIVNDRKSCESLARARHVSIHEKSNEEVDFRLLSKAKGLRTMLQFKYECPGLFDRFSEWRLCPGMLDRLSEWRLLRVVDLSNLKILQLPRSIGSLKHMRYLNLSFNRSIMDLPDALWDLYNLQYLNFDSCVNITNIPEDVRSLISLRYLHLGETQISSLPNSICNLSNLQRLNLEGCTRLLDLPQDIGELHNLRYLSLKKTKISSLPNSICKLSNLHELKLGNCGTLADLPQDIGELHNLRDLDLSYTRISSLPNSICKLSNLHKLNLRNCARLTDLPQNIGELHNLRKLDLSYTRISSLPKSICKLSNLHELNLSDCQRLAYLPQNIGELQNLGDFHLSDTKISSLPKSIKLTSLRGLDRFPVSKGGLGIGELKNIENLGEIFHISCLENVESVEEAVMADLQSKKEIKYLTFEWSSHMPNDNDNSSSSVVRDGEAEVKVLEALEPHPTFLESLSFVNYSGDRFPKWISILTFSSLSSLCMKGLHMISSVADIELPLLWRLYIIECPKLRDVLMVVPELRELILEDCQELTKLCLLPSVHLGDIKIRKCPSLKDVGIPGGLFCLTSLSILIIDYHSCAQLGAGELVPSRSGNSSPMPWPLLRNLTSLWELGIYEFPQLPQDGFPASLESLCIKDCPQLVSFPKEGLPPALKELRISKCPNLTSLPIPPALKELCISKCPNLTSLPKVLHNLKSLRIRKNPNLTSLLSTLHNLTKLTVNDCPHLVSFPERLPPMLRELWIKSCKNLQYLPKDLYNLTSLIRLEIEDCPEVEARPDDRLPPNLQRLIIDYCPKLEQQLQDEDKRDWLYLM